MSADASRIRWQLVAAFAATFVSAVALAQLLGHLWLGLLPVNRMDLGALGMLVVTPVVSLLVFVGAFLGSRDGARATASAARWAGSGIAVPLVVGFELVEFWSTFIGPAPWFMLIAMAVWCIGAPWYFMRANNALLTDAYNSPLRAQYGAAKRER